MKEAYPKSQLLKETLIEWEDFDVASYKLACCLGVLPPEDGSFEGFRNVKWMFASANPVGHSMGQILEDLAETGVLQFDRDNVKIRWNPNYDPPSD
jgi:hypothetical protein